MNSLYLDYLTIIYKLWNIQLIILFLLYSLLYLFMLVPSTNLVNAHYG